MASQVTLGGFDRFQGRFSALPSRISSGVQVTGPAAAYAIIWELGAIHLSKPGPKTMWSTNALGDTVILTIQTPHGYVRINRQRYVQFVQDELSKAQLTQDNFLETIKDVMGKAAQRAADLISQTAPVDTGQLRGSISAVMPDDM